MRWKRKTVDSVEAASVFSLREKKVKIDRVDDITARQRKKGRSTGERKRRYLTGR